MSLKHLCVAPMLRLVARVSPASRRPSGRPAAGAAAFRRGARASPGPRRLEYTYTWTPWATGPASTIPTTGAIRAPGRRRRRPGRALARLQPRRSRPSPGCPPTAPPRSTSTGCTAPTRSTRSRSTTRTPSRATGSRSRAGSSWPTRSFGGPTVANIQLTSVTLGRQATIYTQQNSTLILGNATNLTGFQFTLQGGLEQGGRRPAHHRYPVHHRSPVRLQPPDVRGCRRRGHARDLDGLLQHPVPGRPRDRPGRGRWRRGEGRLAVGFGHGRPGRDRRGRRRRRP